MKGLSRGVKRAVRGGTAALVVVLALSGCAETQFLTHQAKRLGPPDKAAEGTYKIGTPYQIAGVWYYPAEEFDYEETGIASWYGPGFHGKNTANGEVYDMNALTAAHRTLQMPSYVWVTNLENGRSIELKVNDRGPFAHGRIIDVSRRAAQLLGLERQGTARVRVAVNREKSMAAAQALGGRGGVLPPDQSPIKVAALPKDDVVSESLNPPPGGVSATIGNVPAPSPDERPMPAVMEVAATPSAEEAVVRTVPVGPTSIYIQVGAFSRFDNANRVRAILETVGDVTITSTFVNGNELFRARLGPIAAVESADGLLERVIASGYPDARIVVD